MKPGKRAVLAQGHETCNIGNDIYMANIQKCLQLALPSDINVLSKPLIRRFVLSRSLKKIGAFSFKSSKIVDISKPLGLDFDMVVLSGPWIAGARAGAGDEFVEFVSFLKAKRIPYAFLSAGSYAYDVNERDRWSAIFEKYPPLIFASRDDYTFDSFSAFAKYSLKSVCASFFSSINFPITKKMSLVGCWDDNGIYPYGEISKWIKAEGLSGNYIYRPVIDPLSIGNVLKIKMFRSPIPSLVSISYTDYLDYYSQTDLMLSSRVHCCAPVLSYGGEVVLLNKTGRRRLFDAMGVNSRPFPANKSLSIFSLDPAKVQLRYSQFMMFLQESLSDYFCVTP